METFQCFRWGLKMRFSKERFFFFLRRSPEIVSCPTCGRCQVDLIPIAQQVEERLRSVAKPVQVAVMGCVVNGPGEARDADIGVAFGDGSGILFRNGEILRKVSTDAVVDTLLEEIEKL